MKNFICLLLSLVLFTSNLLAQDTTLVKAAEPLGLDKKISNGFEPIKDVAFDIVFYSFDLKNEVEVYETGTKVNDKNETVNLATYSIDAPIKIDVDWDSKVSDKDINIKATSATDYNLSYNFTDENRDEYQVSSRHKFGQPVDIGGYKFKVNNPGNQAFAKTYKFKSNTIAVPFVLIILLLGALFFTLYFKFINFSGFKTAINVVRGKYDHIEGGHTPVTSESVRTDDGDIVDTIRVEGVEGEINHFQALTAALSATVGLGNIAGVAIAIAIGGPGATLWMILAGFLGMASKFTEVTLGVKYREVGPDGTVYGGPMYYLSKGLAERGMSGLGKVFAIFFAVMCIGGSFGGGNMFQSNQAAELFLGLFEFENPSGYEGALFGLVMAVLVGIVIIGGIKRIGAVTEKVVPLMAGIYVLAALIILAVNITAIPSAFGLIFQGAFAPTAVAGGFIGVLVQGFKRAAFSNEAGVGSAAIAHSAVKTQFPASEGIVALLEPFIDTVVICTMTALVIIVTGNYINAEGLNGVELTSHAFNSTIPGFEYVLTLAVVLFAFSTMLSWSYYGLQSWMYLFGRSKISSIVYKLLFCVFIVVGAAASLSSVTDFSDAMVFAMVFPNIIGVAILAPVVKKELDKYMAAIKKDQA